MIIGAAVMPLRLAALRKGFSYSIQFMMGSRLPFRVVEVRATEYLGFSTPQWHKGAYRAMLHWRYADQYSKQTRDYLQYL